MLRPAPSSAWLSSSAVAPAALGRLQSLEKHLNNEDPAFIPEIMQHLEDTIAAIKKLEEIRRQTFECLEEETIKNSNLRFRIQNFPGEIMKELTALVTAARESSAAEIRRLQSALESIADEIALLGEKQTLRERQNAVLCEEKEYLQTQRKEKGELLNERMATKVNTNILVTETCDKIREKEREISRAKAALAELKGRTTEKLSKLEKEREECDKKTREIKTILDTQEAKNSQKKHELESLNTKLLDLQRLITLNSTDIFTEEKLIAKLKEKTKQLEKTLEFKKTDMLALAEQKIQLDSELLFLLPKIAQEKEDFSKDLEKTKEDVSNAERLNKKLKLENKAVRQEYEHVLEEEQHWAIKRDELVAKLGTLSVSLDEKLEFLANRMVVKKNLEKEIENLEERLQNTKKSYAEKLATLKRDLKTERQTRWDKLESVHCVFESKRQINELLRLMLETQNQSLATVMLQWKLLYLAMQRKLFFSEEQDRNRKVNERIKTGKNRHAELLLEIEDLEKKLFQSETQVKALSEEASIREDDYRNYNKDFTNKIKCLENDIKTATENLLKNEQELNTSRLTLEETQKEREQKYKKYEELNKSFLKKKGEEVRAKRAIQQSVEMTGKIKEDTLELRNKLRTKRDAASGQLKNHTESLKLLERDIYEINRKLDIVHAENCRFRLCNAQIKEDIFAMKSEAENHRSATAKLLTDLAVLHDLLLRGWSEESCIHKEFLENEQKILNAVTALTTNVRQRGETIGDINTRLQNALEGLEPLFDRKSTLNVYCFADD